MSRPAAAPGLLAAVAAAAPSRIVKKLDASPGLAEGWRWEGRAGGEVAVAVDAEVTVTVRPGGGVVAEPRQLSCTCLLSPRCLHVLAVAAALPVAEEAEGAASPGVTPAAAPAGPPASAAPASPASPPAPASSAISGARSASASPASSSASAAPATSAASAPTPGGGGQGIAVTATQRAAAAAALRALGEVAGAGAQGTGTVLAGELLRSVHAARVAELPRLAAALLRVASGARACRERSEAFSLPAFADDLGEALATAHALAGGAPADPARWIGTARRSFAEVGMLRLHGLACEPIATASGYAGVVTSLVDGRGTRFTLADVAPGDAGRVPGAYAGAARLGGGAITHRELSRSGLFVEGATASPEGRLGAGQGVRAVLAPPAAPGWAAPPLDGLFRRALMLQVGEAFDALEAGVEAGGLLLLEGAVGGATDEALLLDVATGGEGLRLEAVAPVRVPGLPARDNLRLLAGRAGLRLRAVARLVPDRPLRVALLAVAPGPGETGLVLPPEWAGICNVGLDRLAGASFTEPGAPAAARREEDGSASASAPDALLPLTRRLERLALGGGGTFAGAAEPVEEEARVLERDLVPGAAALLRALCAAARDRGPGRAERLARAMAGASIYLRTARRSLERGAWQDALAGGGGRPAT